MLGTDELGIEIEWRFRFLGYGKSVTAEHGTIFVDLGNSLGQGVIDHHIKETTNYSSTSAIAKNSHFVLQHLLGKLNETYFSGLLFSRKHLTFTFATHRAPDWDGIASFYLINHLVHNGELPPEHVTTALGLATDTIDQGLAEIKNRPIRPFTVYLMIMNLSDNWEQNLIRGCRLIEGLITTNLDNITSSTFLEPFTAPQEFQNEVDALENDYELYREDLKQTSIDEIYVPTKDNTGVKTTLLSFLVPPNCRLFKFWIREEKRAGVLLVPVLGKSGTIDRFRISVDPKSSFSLPCLGYELEQAESLKRSKLGQIRAGKPRYEDQYCDNSDPWYDGRGHGYTIIDSPNVGTILTYNEVVGIVKKLFHKQSTIFQKTEHIDGFISYRRDGGSDLSWAIKTQLELKNKSLFLDVDDLAEGAFGEAILQQLTKSKNFILILSPGALDRCVNDDDWVRCEIREALTMKKNIIPVFKPGFTPPDPGQLPADIREVLNFNGVGINHEYFYASIDKLHRLMKK